MRQHSLLSSFAAAAVAATIALSLAPAPVVAQEWAGRGRLQGQVKDEQGKVVGGAKLTFRKGTEKIDPAAPGVGPEPVLSNDKGRWSIGGLSGGSWSVIIEKEGFLISEGQLTVNEFQAAPAANIVLQKPSAEMIAAQQEAAANDETRAALTAGNAFMQEKKWAEARAEYEKAKPNLDVKYQTQVLRAIGQTYAMENQYEKALVELEAARALDPNDADTLNLIAQTQYQANQPEKAIETLKALLAAKPGDASTTKMLVDLLIDAGREAEAKPYEAMLPAGVKVDPVSLLNIGIRNYNDGKYEKALESFNRVVSENPGDGRGLLSTAPSLCCRSTRWPKPRPTSRNSSNWRPPTPRPRKRRKCWTRCSWGRSPLACPVSPFCRLWRSPLARRRQSGRQLPGPPSAPPASANTASIERRYVDDLSGRIVVTVLSLPAQLTERAEGSALVQALSRARPERRLVVLSDGALSPWPRDPFLFFWRSGRPLLLARPNRQVGREGDIAMASAVVAAWGSADGPRVETAQLPFHAGQFLTDPERLWLSIHSVETDILERLGLGQVPARSFETVSGISDYLEAARAAAEQFGRLLDRRPVWVHPLEPLPELFADLAPGAGLDLDSYVTLLPGNRAFVASVSEGRQALASATSADLESLRSFYGLRLDREPLRSALLEAHTESRALALGTYLDRVAGHLQAQALIVERIPIVRVPSDLFEDRQGVDYPEFFLSWNNVVLEVIDGAPRAEGFELRFPSVDRAMAARLARAGVPFTAFPPAPPLDRPRRRLPLCFQSLTQPLGDLVSTVRRGAAW